MQTISFSATTGAIISVFLLGLLGYISVRRRVLSQHGVTELARLLVDFILPAALFYAMYTQYSPERFGSLKWVGAAQICMMLIGGVVAWACCRLLRVRSHHGTLIVLSSMQNNIYLPLPLAVTLMTGAAAQKAVFYIGTYVLFFTPLLWSFGVVLIGPNVSRRFASTMRYALNPPFIASVLGIVVKSVFLRLGLTMPALVLTFSKTAGDATTPMAMIVLGAMLAEVHWSSDFEPRAVAIVTAIKLLVLPLLATLALHRLKTVDPIFAFITLVQASCPPATNISLVAKRFGGNESLVALTLLITYLLSIFTIPLWLSTL
jgi:predicted permease